MRRLLGAVIIATIASSPALAQCSDAEKARLEEFDRTWGATTIRGDRAVLQTIYADDYMGATLIGTQDKTSAINDAVAAAERNRANPQSVPRLSFDNYIITCTPASGTITHRNVAITTVSGKDQTTYSRSVHILEKRGGRWQVVSNAGHALTDAAVLLYMENDWNEAIKKHDATWIERNYADDATDISGRTGALQTKAQAIVAARNDKSVIESIDMSEMNVRMEGNVAIITGVLRERGRDDQGKPMDRRVRFADTYIRRDGRWQVWATQGTVIP